MTNTQTIRDAAKRCPHDYGDDPHEWPANENVATLCELLRTSGRHDLAARCSRGRDWVRAVACGGDLDELEQTAKRATRRQRLFKRAANRHADRLAAVITRGE